MEPELWRKTFAAEIEKAEAARAVGNEGMARVCARRAAGILAGEFLRRLGQELVDPSAYTRIVAASQRAELTPQARRSLNLFLLRVTTDHALPVEADLVAEAKWLAQTLLG